MHSPEQIARALADAVRSGDLDGYLSPGVLSRLRSEAMTGHARSPEEWDMLQRSLETFRHAEDGDRVEPKPFAKRHEHARSMERAPLGSDQQVIHSFNRGVNQRLEDEQTTEMLQGQMGTDNARPPDRLSLRDSLEAAYEIHQGG